MVENGILQTIKDSIANINNEIKGSCAKLIGVTKTKPVEMILEAYSAGLRDFGENHTNELLAKIDELPKDIRWHMIGHLQTNKVKALLKKDIFLIHSVDSLKLAETINKFAGAYNKKQNVLLEVNITGESSKTGYSLSELYTDIPNLIKLQNINILGLMCVAKKGESSVKYFEKLKQIMTDINNKFNINLKELSMGMTNDYVDAIKCGATYIRVGRAIFGERI